MTLEPVQLSGITRDDIQNIFENTLNEFKTAKTRIVYLDASYLYSFDLDDFPEVRKLCLLTRYDHSLAPEWHKLLERWFNDSTVHINDRLIKPIKISRTFDRIVNEGMESIAAAVCGQGSVAFFPYRTIGDGNVSLASPSDTILTNEIDRIEVNTTPEGGSLSRDGSTVYSIGNHSVNTPTPNNEEFTECGMHSSSAANTDKMLDHSIFEDPVPHVQFADAPGSTTCIYMCSV